MDTVTHTPVKEKSVTDQINELHKELVDAMNGRKESEIPMGDPYWSVRTDVHQRIWKLEGK